jgi:DNA-binding Lrp family transcriptional regulator
MALQKTAQLTVELNDLSDTDRLILELIMKSGLGISFQGLKRALGIHQESLSRGLKRLIQLGLIIKRDADYVAARRSTAQMPEWYVVIESVLPRDADKDSLFALLRNKWFKDLRWFGSSQDGKSLVWTTVGGDIKIMVKFVDNDVLVETDAVSGENVSLAIKLAHTVFEHLSRALSRLETGSGIGQPVTQRNET